MSARIVQTVTVTPVTTAQEPTHSRPDRGFLFLGAAMVALAVFMFVPLGVAGQLLVTAIGIITCVRAIQTLLGAGRAER